VRDAVGLRPQRIALLDAEPVLFVHHHEPEFGELHLLPQERVRADHDPRRPGGDVQEGRAPRRRRLRARQERHARAGLGAAQHPGLRERPHERADRAQVLRREHLGGGQEGGLPAGVDHLEHRPQCHHRLPGAHLALEEALHRVRQGEVLTDLGPDHPLAGGQREGQGGVEGGEQSERARRPGRRGEVSHGRPPARERRLEHERLLEAHPRPGPPPLGVVVGPVQATQGLDQAGKALGPAHLLGQRIGKVVRGQGIEHRSDGLLDLPRRDRRARGVHRHRLGRLDQGRGLGVDVVEGEEVGVHQLALAAVEVHGSREQAGLPHLQAVLEVLGHTRLPGEEGQREARVAVRDGRREHPRGAGGRLAQAHVRHLRQDCHVLAHGQVREVREPARLLVAARVVAQEVLDRLEPEPRERLGGLGPDRSAERLGGDVGHSTPSDSAGAA